MTPPAFIAACLDRARATGSVVVGVRPVTDTVKVVADDRVGDTLDRASLLAVTSPLVIPAEVVAELPERPSADLARAVADLAAAGHRVETLEAPPEGRRVTLGRGRTPARRPHGRGALSSTARATSSGKVTFRLSTVLGTAATATSAYAATQAAVSVPSKPSPAAAR